MRKTPHCNLLLFPDCASTCSEERQKDYGNIEGLISNIFLFLLFYYLFGIHLFCKHDSFLSFWKISVDHLSVSREGCAAAASLGFLVSSHFNAFVNNFEKVLNLILQSIQQTQRAPCMNHSSRQICSLSNSSPKNEYHSNKSAIIYSRYSQPVMGLRASSSGPWRQWYCQMG